MESKKLISVAIISFSSILFSSHWCPEAPPPPAPSPPPGLSPNTFISRDLRPPDDWDCTIWERVISWDWVCDWDWLIHVSSPSDWLPGGGESDPPADCCPPWPG